MRGRLRVATASLSPELLLVALLWGAVFAAGKAAVDDVPAFTVAFLRFGLASLALLPLYLRERRRAPARLGFAGWRAIALLALTAVFGYNALFFSGLTHAPSSDSILLTPTTNPIWTALLAAMLLGERVTQRLAIAMVVALGGMALVLAGGASGSYDRERLIGNLLFIVAAVVFALSHVVSRVATRYISPLGATTLAGLLGSALLLPAALAQGGLGALADVGVGFWLAVGFIAFAGTALAYVLWYRSVSRVGAGQTGFYTNLVPIFGLTISALTLGEYPTPLQALGGVVMLAAVIWGAQRRATPSPAPTATTRVVET